MKVSECDWDWVWVSACERVIVSVLVWESYHERMSEGAWELVWECNCTSVTVRVWESVKVLVTVSVIELEYECVLVWELNCDCIR